MSIGLYPGTFDPFHSGHGDILKKSLKIFSKVIILLCENPDKDNHSNYDDVKKAVESHVMIKNTAIVDVMTWEKPLVKFFDLDPYTYDEREKPSAIIRGLRNGHDLQYEMNNQYWNEDVGLKAPFVYFITDRKLSHVSSSAIRSVEKIGLHHNYRD